MEIVEYKEEYKDSCIDLLDQIFTAGPNRPEFEWRFENRGSNRPIIVCAIDENKVISFNSWIPWKFTYRNKTFIGYQSGKSATDVNYRRKGIWERILIKADDLFRMHNVDFLYGFPGSMSYGAACKAGYYPIGIYNVYMRLLFPFQGKNIAVNKFKDHEVINFNRIIDRNKMSSIFDHAYFQWRYIQNPKSYNFVFYEENNNKALFIVRERKNIKYFLTINELLLLDCHFSSLNQSFIENAIKYLSQMYASKAHYIKTFFNPNSDKGRSLERLFHIRRSAHYETLAFKPISDELNDTDFFNCNNWDIFPHIKDVL